AHGQEEPTARHLGRRRSKCCTRKPGPRGTYSSGCALHPVRAAADPGEGAQGRERVVADAPRPGEVPEDRGERLVVRGPDSRGQLPEEECASSSQRLKDGLVLRRLLQL